MACGNNRGIADITFSVLDTTSALNPCKHITISFHFKLDNVNLNTLTL